MAKTKNWKKKISKVLEILRIYGFQPTKLSCLKRKRNDSFKTLNVLPPTFDKGLFCLCQICGSDYDINHTVTITENWIFDSNHEHALPLGQDGMDVCCSTKNEYIFYEKCTLVYKFVHNDIP